MKPHLSNTKTLALLAICVSLVASCAYFEDDTLRVERVDLQHSAMLPGWEEVGPVAATQSDKGLTLTPGVQFNRTLSDEDYPIAMRFEAEFGGEAGGIGVVTRSPSNRSGPLGFPTEGVAFLVFGEEVLDFHPFNTWVFWIRGDRMTPLGSARVRTHGRPMTVDIYDNGRWVMLAIDGEVLVASVTPDHRPVDTSFVPYQVRGVADMSAEMLDAVIPDAALDLGDISIVCPVSPRNATSRTHLANHTLLINAPEKTEGARERWEQIAHALYQTWSRPIEGWVREADSEDPITGAVITVNPGGRSVNSDFDGRFFDTLTPPGDAEDWTVTVRHPDFPTMVIGIASMHEAGRIECSLPREGDGAVTIDISGLRNGHAPITDIALRRADRTGTSRAHPMPPAAGPVRFRYLVPGEYVVEVIHADASVESFISEPFMVDDSTDQVITFQR